MKINILIMFFLTGCLQTCYQKLTDDPVVESQKICLNSDGSGRITLADESFRFSYESLLEKKENRFAMALNFAFFGEEFMELRWEDDEVSLNSELEMKILQNSSQTDAAKLHQFMELWSELLKDIIELQEGMKDDLFFKWKVEGNQLKAVFNSNQVKTQAEFYNAKNDVFSRMVLSSRHLEQDKTYRIEYIVSKCLNPSE
jgi:hypothetical protein